MIMDYKPMKTKDIDWSNYKIIEVYPYRDENNILQFQIVRGRDKNHPKIFSIRHPSEGITAPNDNNRKHWEWNMKGVKVIPYLLPELIASNGTVFLFEGEKDCNNAKKWDLTVSTNPLGALKWIKYEKQLNPWFENRDIIIIPDNDLLAKKPHLTGEKHMIFLADSLKFYAKSIKILRLPEAKDFSDWLEQDKNNTLEKFLTLAHDAEDWDKIREKTISEAKIKEAELKGEEIWDISKVVLSTAEFMSLDIKEPEFIIDPWLSQGEFGIVTGPPGIGKTYWIMSMAENLAKGQIFGPWNMPKKIKCLYVDAELPLYQLKHKIKALGISEEQKNLYWYSAHHAYQIDEKEPLLENEIWQRSLKEFLLENEIKFLVLDNIGDLCPGRDENDAKSWDIPNAFCKQLRYESITTILIHHPGKDISLGPRGTSKIEGNADFSILLHPTENKNPSGNAQFILTWRKKRFEVKPEEKDIIFGLEWELQKNETGEKSIWTYNKIEVTADWKIAYLHIIGWIQSKIAGTLKLRSQGSISKILQRLATENLLKIINPDEKKKKYQWTDIGRKWFERKKKEEKELNPEDETIKIIEERGD